MREPRQVVSLSGGKDSTALLLMMLEREEKVDEAVMFDGGWEFPEMHEHIERLRRFIDVPITILKPPHPLEWYMTEYLMKRRKRKGEFGYGFPRPHARWCTRIKVSTISRYLCGNETVCIGIAADEDRPLSPDFRYPLVEWGVTEKEALAYCLSHGFDWGGAVRAYGQGFVLVLPFTRVGFRAGSAQDPPRTVDEAPRDGARLRSVPGHVSHRLLGSAARREICRRRCPDPARAARSGYLT